MRVSLWVGETLVVWHIVVSIKLCPNNLDTDQKEINTKREDYFIYCRNCLISMWVVGVNVTLWSYDCGTEWR